MSNPIQQLQQEKRERERAVFLETRRSGLGGSDMAAIMGMSPFRTALDVYLEKTAEPGDERWQQPDSAILQRGRAMEPLIRTLWEEQGCCEWAAAPRLQHPEYEWAIGNPDGYIVDISGNTIGVLEIKCLGVTSFQKVKLYGIPEHYMIQMQHYLWLSGYYYGEFAVFSPERWELLTIPVTKDPALIEAMAQHGEHFWANHVVPRVPPIVETTERREEVPKYDGTIQPLPIHARNLARQVLDAKALVDEARLIEVEARERLAVAMGMGCYEDKESGIRVYRTMQEGRRTLDKKALQAAHPELDLTPFEKAGKPFETLRLYEIAPTGSHTEEEE